MENQLKDAGFIDDGKSPIILPEIADHFKFNPLIILPTGSTEQHGAHLPAGTDIFSFFVTLTNTFFIFVASYERKLYFFPIARVCDRRK